jgi:hypothetical protein
MTSDAGRHASHRGTAKVDYMSKKERKQIEKHNMTEGERIVREFRRDVRQPGLVEPRLTSTLAELMRRT